MELQQIAALVLAVAVLAASAGRWIHRAAVALVGVLLIALYGMPNLLGALVPEALLVTAGLMVLSGFLKKSGVGSWLALSAAQFGGGRPKRILVLLGVLTYLLAGLVGPIATVALVVPVAALLATELDIPPLPFIIVLSWTSLLGGATVLTAQPSNLWVGSVLGVHASTWMLGMLPYTAAALVVTLVLSLALFNRSLRATNERRARVLEFDVRQSLPDAALAAKTISVLAVVIAGLVAGPWLGLSPSLVAVGGAVILWLSHSPATDAPLNDLNGGTLLFFAGWMIVTACLQATGTTALLASFIPPSSLAILGGSAVLGAVVDHGAAAGLIAGLLKAMPTLWPFLVLGTTLGAGATVLGSASNAAALDLAGQGVGKPTWRDFTKYGLLIAAVNLVVVGALALLLAR